MKRVIVFCEGPTEETFVNKILSPAFYDKKIFISARNFGGVSRYSIIKKHLTNLCKSDTSACGMPPKVVDDLCKIRHSFQTPEHINNSPDTAPSKRILSLYPRYSKIVDGYQISSEIGLDTIRSECGHFDQWMQKLEDLSEV